MPKSRYLFSILLCFYFIVCSGFSSNSVRDVVKHTYESQIGVREKTGHNDGAMVETYLHYCSLGKGNPWCASFVCWTYGQAHVMNPRSGYCPDLFSAKKVIYRRGFKNQAVTPKPGDVWGLYFPEKGRVAHVGFVDDWGTKYVTTVEGNTNEAGSREGDGVYRKRRPVRSIYVVASYIN